MRYGRVWRNLPLRVKTATWLLAPLPLLASIAAVLSLLGIRSVPVFIAAGFFLEFAAAAWLMESLLRSIRDFQDATDRMLREEPIPESLPHSWELNRVGQNLSAVASLLPRRRLAAKAADELMARVFEEAPVGYLEVDREGTVRRVNRAAADLLGRAPAELCGRPAAEVLGIELAPATSEAHAIEQLYVRPDGARRLLSVRGHARRAAGAEGGTLYSVADITERLRTAEKIAEGQRELRLKDEEVAQALARAAEADQTRSRFLSHMSDELRVPLNGMIGFAELLFDGKVGALSAEQRECLGDILSSGHQLLRLVNDLLDAAGTASGKPSAVPRETVDLEAMIQEVRYVMEVLSAPKRRVQISSDVEPAVRKISGDPVRLKQIVQSYLSAAVKVSPKGGSIAVRVAAEGRNAIRLEVEHSRAGGHERSAEEGDPRLGNEAALALAKQLVEEQGGRVGARSSHGRGSLLFAVIPTGPCAEGSLTLLEEPADAERFRESLESPEVRLPARVPPTPLSAVRKMTA